MYRYGLKRLIQVPVTLLVVMAVVFIMLHSSGNLVNLLLPQDATAAQRAQLTHELHLDQPLLTQFGTFIWNTLHGDFGTSAYYSRPAMSVVLDRLPATVELALVAMVLAVVVGVALGIVAARRPGSPLDITINAVTVFGQSMPSFWLGLMLILYFAVKWQVLPTSGYGTASQFVLPSVTLAAFLIPQILLLTRSSMIDALNEQYMVTAQSKGLSPRVMVTRHALRNALGPVIASIGLQFGSLLGGAVLTEAVFAWPGVGSLSVEAILHRDVPVVEACVVVLALAVMLSNLAVDLLNAVLDPRVRVHS
jgi:peptide/nickel transport system permease protein